MFVLLEAKSYTHHTRGDTVTETQNLTIIEEMEALAERATIEIVTLENQRADIDTQIKRLRKLQTAVAADQAPSRRTAKSNGAGKRAVKRTHIEKGRQTADYILGVAEPDDTFTVLEVHEGMGNPWSQPHSYAVFNYLREIGFLAKVGKDPETKREIWRVDDADTDIG